MQWHNSKTGELQSEKPGATIVSQEYWDSLYSDWEQVSLDFRPPVPLIDLKSQKWAEIKLARDAEERSLLPYRNKLFDFDALSSERLAWAISAATTAKLASQAFTVDWTTYDNTIITMTADDILGLPIAVAVRSNEVHQKARGLRQEIEDAETVENLDLINW
jgi:hypothetical protein